jgi:signal transduction histidine kinase
MVLQGYITIMEENQPDPTLNEYLQKVTIAAQRISAMIRFTKEYEKIGISSPVWQDVQKLVDTVAKETHLGKVQLESDIPIGTEVYADPLVAKVFYNLMDNAVQHGAAITTIRFSSQEKAGDRTIICEDDGDGVPAGEKEKIFERGFGKNTGMGLFLAREILDITGITICETGEPGKGARFEIIVPKGMWRTGNGA